MSGSREKLRALFLAFVMVMSIFGATVAFSGSAAANATSITVAFDSDTTNSANTDLGGGGSGNPTVTPETPAGSDTSYVVEATVASGAEAVIALDADGDGGDGGFQNDEVLAVVEDGGSNDLSGDSTDGTVIATVDFTEAEEFSASSVGETQNIGVVEETGDDVNGQDDTFTNDNNADNTVTLNFESVIEVDSDDDQRADTGANALDTVISGTGSPNNDNTLQSGETVIVNSEASSGTTNYDTVVGGLANSDLTVIGTEDTPTLDADGAGATALTADSTGLTLDNVELLGDTDENVIAHNTASELTIRDSRIVPDSSSPSNNAFGIDSDNGVDSKLSVDNTEFVAADTTDASSIGDAAGIFLNGVGDGTADDATDTAVDITNSNFNNLDFAVQVNEGKNIDITGNNIDTMTDEAIIVNTDEGAVEDVEISDNSINNVDTANGGSHAVIFFNDGNNGFTGPLKVTNNDFTSVPNLALAADDNDFSNVRDSEISGVVINATRNFWGDASGPGGAGPGSGAGIDDQVVFAQVDSIGTNLMWLDSENGDQVEALDVSLNPSSVTRGDSATISATVTQGGSTYDPRVQYALVGLSNNQSDESSIGPRLDQGGSNAIDSQVLTTGSTTSGSFSVSLTANGAGDSDNSDTFRAIDEYYVVVRPGSQAIGSASQGDVPGGDTGDSSLDNNLDGNRFSTPNVFFEDTLTDSQNTFSSGDVFNIAGAEVFRAGPNGTVSASSTQRGTSVTIEGSATLSNGDGFANYPVDLRNAEAPSNVKNINTVSDGSFATSEVLEDAATHAVTVPLYNTSINDLDASRLGTFEVSPDSVETTTDTDEISAVQTSSEITLTTETASNNDNVTRFQITGADLESLDLNIGTDSDNGVIEQLTLSDGTTFGGVDDDEVASDIGDDSSFTSSPVFSTANEDTATLASDASVTIESAVLLASDQGTADNTVEFAVDPAESGSIDVEGQVEDTDQGSDADNFDTPDSPDFVGTTSISVSDPQDLNVLLNPASDDLSNAIGDGTETQLDVTVLDADGNGLISGASSGDIQAVNITLEGQGTQFGIDGGVDAEDGNSDDDATFGSGTSDNLDSASVTIEDGDVGQDSSVFTIDDLDVEQNGTIAVNVTADVNGQDADLTASQTFTPTQTDAVSGLPSGTFTVDSSFDTNITVSTGEGSPLNTRRVDIGDPTTDSNSFAVDTDGDGSDEVTGIDAIRLNGQNGQAEFETNGDGDFGEQSTSILINDGQYTLDNITITNAGETLSVDVRDTGGNVHARFPSQFSTTGTSAFNISSDKQTLVAGFTETANLTISENGSQLTGSDLTSLLNNDAGAGAELGDSVTQGGSELSELDGAAATDTNDDGTVDVAQVDILATSTNDINVSVDNGDATQVGSTSIDVVEPEIETNVENNVLTERLNQSVDVTAIDPRDGSRLASGDETADIRVTVLNGTAELRDLDDKQDTTSGDVDSGSPDGQAFELNDNGDNTRDALVASNVANSNLSLAALPYDPDNEQFKLEFQVDSDAGNFFGSTNVTVEPPQVTATPSSITLGSQETLEVIAEDANGNALAQRSIRLDGAVQPISGSTDDSGFVAVTVNPQATGTINVHTASADDIETSDLSPAAIDADGSIEDTVNVTTEQNEFNVTVDPQTVTANESSTVTVTATNNASGDAVEGASVDLSGAGVNQSAQTDANGQATFDVNASQAGTIDVTVDDAGFTEATASITVQQPSEPVATVTFDDQTVPNGTEEVTVASANFTRADGSAGDYVVVVHVVNETRFDGGVDDSISTPVGASENLSNGAENITVDLNSSAAFEDGDALDSLTENVTLRAMLHTTDNESAFGTRLGVAIDGLERGDETDDANITVQDEPASDPVERFDTNGEPGIQSGEVLDAISAFNEGEEGVESGDVLDVISAFNEA